MWTLPVWPFLQGPQSGTTTGPATPGLPMWMWAASALPVRRGYVSFQVSSAPVFFSTYFALNAPFASRALFGFGTSVLFFSVALTVEVCAAPAKATTTRATVAGAATINTSFFTTFLPSRCALPGRCSPDAAGRIDRAAAATLFRNTYGGDQVSTWSVLRLSCRSRSPVGLVKQPGTNVSADNELALAA